jgi:hypothetical protein
MLYSGAMYRVPVDLDLSAIIGQSTTQVRVGHLTDDSGCYECMQISVEGAPGVVVT